MVTQQNDRHKTSTLLRPTEGVYAAITRVLLRVLKECPHFSGWTRLPIFLAPPLLMSVCGGA